MLVGATPMNTAAPRHPTSRFVIKHYVEILTALTLLFVLQTGLVPFDFFQDAPGEGARGFFSAATDRFTLPDIVSNVFLYVPLGLLFHACIRRYGIGGLTAWLLAVCAAALVSVGIEFLQSFSLSRVSSILDLLANVAGAAIGALIAALAHWLLPRFLGAALYECHSHPQAALVKGYLLVLVVAAAMPFSFSFDAGRLKRAVDQAQFVPFAAPIEHAAAAEEALAAGDQREYALAKWAGLKRWSRWSMECLSFAILVWLAYPVLRRQYGFTHCGARALLWWSCGFLAIGLSLLQLPILTRGCDTTDILFRWLGLGLGVFARSTYSQAGWRWPREEQERLWHNLGWLGCWATLAYILYTGLIPFTFDVEAGGAAKSVSSMGFLPFFAYFVTRFDLMIDDAMEKFAAYAVFAALLTAVSARLANTSVWTRMRRVAVLGVSISVMIEIVQMYMPVRVASLTDPILAFCGCSIGVMAKEQAVAFYWYAVTHEMIGPEGMRRDEGVLTRMPTTDELIGTLIEPHPEAPVEMPPTPKHAPEAPPQDQ